MTSDRDGRVPARGYSWAPFEPGNELSMRHGAYSPRRVDPLARELVDLVLADPAAGHAHAPHHRAALWSWARAQAQIQLFVEYLAEAGEASGDGVGDLGDERVRAAYLALHRAEARAATWSARLGLDPLSQARMGRDRAAASVDMARLMAELEKRDKARAAGVVDVDLVGDAVDEVGGPT